MAAISSCTLRWWDLLLEFGDKNLIVTKTSQEIEQEFIHSLKAVTSRDLNNWMKKIGDSGIDKRNDIIHWLKTENEFGHMHASLLVGIYFNNGKPVYASSSVLLDSQFEKYQDMRELFDLLINKITNWDSKVEVLPKKTYVSLTKKREFAAINIKKGELRLGMDLGDRSFDDRVQKSRLTGPMSRISHMVLIRNQSEMDNELITLLETADKRVNG